MKYMIISDIHGSKKYLENVLNIYEKNDYDKLIILGDILYHGPRNPLPLGYSPKECIVMLNKYADDIIAVRGNCDSEVDQMVLNFPIMSDYKILELKRRKAFLTHGHLYNSDNLPKLSKGDLLIHGHTHVLTTDAIDNYYLLNPGSITLPKQKNPNTYAVLSDEYFIVYKLDGKIYKTLNF